MSIAAIAIGSNSTRMLVRLADGREVRERAYTHLFMGLNQDRMLTAEAMSDTTAVIGQLKRRALAMGAERVYLYATSAVRDAGNADAFSRRLLLHTGLELTVISGEAEARLAFEAASCGGHCAVFDLGGGSSELTYGKGSGVIEAASAQEGAARLSRECTIRTFEDAENVRLLVGGRLRGPYCRLLALPRPSILIGIGGTCTTSAAIQQQNASHGDELNGETVKRDFIEALLRRIIPLSLEERTAIPGLYASRAAILPHGLCILLALMDLTGFDCFRLSTHNNLDAIVERLDKNPSTQMLTDE